PAFDPPDGLTLDQLTQRLDQSENQPHEIVGCAFAVGGGTARRRPPHDHASGGRAVTKESGAQGPVQLTSSAGCRARTAPTAPTNARTSLRWTRYDAIKVADRVVAKPQTAFSAAGSRCCLSARSMRPAASSLALLSRQRSALARR